MTVQNRRSLWSDRSERVQALERRLQIEMETRDRETADLYLRLTHLHLEVEESGCSAGEVGSLPPEGSPVRIDDGNVEVGRGATWGLLRIIGRSSMTLRRSLVNTLHQEGLIGTSDRSSGGARRPFAHLQKRDIIEAVTSAERVTVIPRIFFA